MNNVPTRLCEVKDPMSTVKTTRFELTGADGGPLRGEVRTVGSGEARPAVIICHGFKGFKDWGFFPKLAERLARAGLTAITFNFSGSGIGPDGESFSEPQRFSHSTFSNDLIDLETVAGALARNRLCDGLDETDRYGLFGHSRGGGTAVLYAAGNTNVPALVTWSAIAKTNRWDAETVTRWRADGKLDIVNTRTGEVLPMFTDILDDIELSGQALDVTSAAARVGGRWLILHGAADEAVSIDEARILYDASNKETTEIHVIPGGTHTFGAQHPWSGYTAELESVVTRTIAWFSRYLL
jgi:dienelactone hydrolase